MSTIDYENIECSICKETNRYPVLMSTNTFGGGPDLDLRPAEMQRSTMDFWIQECPNCGYVAPYVSIESKISSDFLKSDRYLTCEGINYISSLASTFYKHYLISMEHDDIESAFYALLHAAWSSDDCNDIDNAILCRKKAIVLVDKLIRNDDEDKDSLILIKADLKRRAKEFDDMDKEFEGIVFSEDLLNKILKFQLAKAKEKDDSCYRVEDVEKQ